MKNVKKLTLVFTVKRNCVEELKCKIEIILQLPARSWRSLSFLHLEVDVTFEPLPPPAVVS